MKWYCLISLVLFCSCSDSLEKSADENEPITIDFYAAEKRRIYMDELFDKIEVIPLETTQDCLLQEYPGISGVTDDYLLLTNFFAGARLFDRKDGHFIHNVGKKGQGPDEYFLVGGTFCKGKNLMYVDKENAWLGIDIETNKVEERVKKPRFTNVKFAGGVSNPYRLNDSLYMGYINNVTGDIKYKITIFNKDGESVRLFPNRLLYPKKNMDKFYYPSGHFYHYKNDLCFYSGIVMDTIYTVKDTCLQTRYIFHFNENSFPYEKMDSPEFRILDYCSLNCMMEYDRNLLFTYRAGNFDEGVGFYDKNKKTTVLCSKEDRAIHFRDENYPSLYPRYMDEEGNVAGLWTASEWLEFVEEHAGSIDIPENLRGVKYDDNLILVVARMKK